MNLRQQLVLPVEGTPDRTCWSVWRRDDHGNAFEVSRGHTRAEAQRLVEEFESRGHKQHYWAEHQRLDPQSSRG